jgi:hypothetical protein
VPASPELKAIHLGLEEVPCEVAVGGLGEFRVTVPEHLLNDDERNSGGLARWL